MVSQNQILVQFIMFACQQIVKSCSYFELTSTNNQQIITEQELPNSVLQMQENIGFGIWMNYRPFFQIGIINNRDLLSKLYENQENINDQGYFIYSVFNKFKAENILVTSINFDRENLKVIHNVYYNFKKQQKTIQFQYDMNEYEGKWILFYCFFDQLVGRVTLEFYKSDLNSIIMSQTIDDLPQFGETLIHQSAGISYYKNENQELFILNQFQGIISEVLSADQSDFESNVKSCESYLNYCFQETLYLSIFDEEFFRYRYTLTYSAVPGESQYLLKGWVKLNQLIYNQLEVQFIRITINMDYNDDLYIGDRDLYIKYYQNVVPSLNGFEINTYSFIIPLKERYTTPEDLKIKAYSSEYFEAVTKWHFIHYQIGTKVENKQPLYQVYFPSLNQVQQFRFPVQITHFTGTTFLVLVGYDVYTQNYFEGRISNLELLLFCEDPAPVFQVVCHYSCQECNGPTQFDCLSCSINSFRQFSILENSCLCQPKYIDIEEVICQAVEEAFPQIQIVEQSISCELEGYDLCQNDSVQCSFGYFQYKMKCIQCPYYSEIYSKIRLTCLDCFAYSETFSEKLLCSKEALAFHEDEFNSYQIISKDISSIQYFILSSTEEGTPFLQICEGCIGKNLCKPGYFLQKANCQKCIKNCIDCENEIVCNKCKVGYYLTQNLQCHLCDNCKECEFQAILGQVKCKVCKDGKEVQPIESCVDCGLNCQACDKLGYCNYCFNGLNNYYLSLDGKNCYQCNIINCLQCFQYINYKGTYITTFDIQFRTSRADNVEVKLGCALCKSNYFFNFMSNKCEIKKENDQCEFAVIQVDSTQQCIIGPIGTDSIQVIDCNEIKFCMQCIKNYVQSNSFCIICMDGYYAGVLSGQCTLCPVGCKTCVQQNIQYQDFWKQSIRAFYKYFVNSKGDHSFENFATTNSINDLQIICTSCPEQTILFQNICIFGCQESCQKCEIINQKAICTKCPKIQDVLLKNQDENGACSFCPNFCSACLTRNDWEINQINPYFVQTYQNSKYAKICYEIDQNNLGQDSYYFNQLRIIQDCQKYKKCFKKIIITNTVYCSTWDYMVDSALDPQFSSKFINDIGFFSMEHMNYLDSEQVLNYLQDIQPAQISYEFFFKQGDEAFCILNAYNAVVSVKALQKIFSLQQVDIKFIGLKIPTQIKILNTFQISNFTNIYFQNIEFDFSYNMFPLSQSSIISLYNLNENLILHLEDCSFTSSSSEQSYKASFYSNHSYSLNITNMKISNLKILESKLFSFSGINSHRNSSILVQNLTIIHCQLEESIIFEFTQLKSTFKNNIVLQKITILNTQFITSSFLKGLQESNNTLGDVQIREIYIDGTLLSQDSSFILLLVTDSMSINSLWLKNSILSKNSLFYQSNIINLKNAEISQVVLQNSSLIVNQLNDQIQLDNQQNVSFLNIKFQNIEYDNFQQFIKIVQLSELIEIQLNFENVVILDNYYSSTIPQNQISFTQSLIYLECKFCYLQDIIIQRKYGLPEFSIIKSQVMMMKNVHITQNNQFYPRLLHSSINCIKQFLNFSMSFFIFIGKYENVTLENISILESISLNSAIIIFKGYDLLEKVIKEQISIKNSIFNKNLIVISEEFKSASILYFESSQESEITLLGLIFQKNHLNEYYQDQSTVSATTILLQQSSGSLKIENSQFIENILTNSTDSILYVQTHTTIISNVTFILNNIINFFNLKHNLLTLNQQYPKNAKLTNDDLLQIFPVHSKGGNGYFIVNKFQAQHLLINTSYAQQGGCFSFQLKGSGRIEIHDSEFFNIQTSFDSSFNSYGGCLLIDAQSSLLFFLFTNTLINTSASRSGGGGIYILPSITKNSVNLSNLKVVNSFSTTSSFLCYKLSKLNKVSSTLNINNITFDQNENGYNNFLSNIDDFSNFEAESFVISNPLIQTLYGNITISDCQLINTYFQFFAFIEEAENIILNNLKFINSTIANSPLIKMTLKQYQTGQIIIRNIELLSVIQIRIIHNLFSANNQSSYLSQLECSQEFSYLSQLECSQELFTQSNFWLDSRDKSQEKLNQLKCNLLKIDQFSETQFSILEINNLEAIHNVKIESMHFKNNKCEGCYFGLIKLQTVDSKFQRNFILDQLELLNNQCGFSGCLVVLGKYSDSPFRSDLLSNRILNQDSSEVLAYAIECDGLLKNSNFINNSAIYGGAVLFVEVKFFILNSQFYFNKAKIGGAIYFFSIDKQLLLFQTKISNNSAQIAGGLFLNNQSLQLLDQFQVEITENNSTNFGSDLFEQPRSLTLVVNTNYQHLEKKSIEKSNNQIIDRIMIKPYKALGYKNNLLYLTFPSGRPISSYQYFDSFSQQLIPYNLTLRIIPLNKFNKQIRGLNGHQCNITPKVMNSSSNQINSEVYYALSFYNVTYNNQTEDFNFDQLIIYFNPNYDESLYLRLIIQCDFVSVPIYDSKPPYLIIDYMTYQLQVDIKTFKCQLGEFLNITSGGCVLCDSFQNQYQVSWSAQSCSYKDDIKMKSIESSMIELRPHYWRAYYYSSNVQNCYHLEENCLGGWLPGDQSCTQGHIGALCEQCDLYDTRGDGSFSVSSIYSCRNCENITINVVSIILISLWTLISTLVSVESTVRMIEEFIIGLKLKSFGIIVGIQTASTAILIKIVTNYLQIISSITTFQLQVPVGLQTSFNSVANPIEQIAYSLDCFLITISDIEIIYFRIIWSLIMATLYIFIFFLLGKIGDISNLIKFSTSHQSTALLYLFIYLQPSLINGLISLISYRIISDEYWVQGNVAYRYGTYQHIKWLLSFCLPFLTLFGFVLPFLFWYGIFKNRNELDKSKTRKIWGYLYNEYKHHSYYWETIKIIQKELIIIVLVYYDDHIPIKASLVFLILFGYSYQTQQNKPYQTSELNFLDSQSTIICAISIILGSAIFSAQQQNLQEIVWPFYIVIGILNSLYITKMIIKICFAYFQKLSETIDKIKEFIARKFPYFLSFTLLYRKALNVVHKKVQELGKISKKLDSKQCPKLGGYQNLKSIPKLLYQKQSIEKFKIQRSQMDCQPKSIASPLSKRSFLQYQILQQQSKNTFEQSQRIPKKCPTNESILQGLD